MTGSSLGCEANNTNLLLQASPTPLYWRAFRYSNDRLPSSPRPDLTPYERFTLAIWASHAVKRLLAISNEKPNVRHHSEFLWYIPSTGPAPTEPSRRLVFDLAFFELNPEIAPHRKFMMEMDPDQGISSESTITAFVYDRLLSGQYDWMYAAYQKHTGEPSRGFRNPHFSITPLGNYTRIGPWMSLHRELAAWTHKRLETAVLSYAWRQSQRNLTLGAS